MKAVIALFATFAICCNMAFAQTCVKTTYNSNLNLACEGTELEYLWPNYDNNTQFYRCQGAKNRVTVNCPAATYFSFVYQSCNACDAYIPAVACEYLTISSASSCGASDNSGEVTSGPSEPTPIYPNTTVTATPAPDTTTTSTTTSSTTTTTTTAAPITTPTQSPPTTIPTTTEVPQPGSSIPPPPSPSTNNPDIPTPPTQPPTPPTIVNTPPTDPLPANA